MKLLLNPDLEIPDNSKPEEILKDKNYSSLVIGSKAFFNLLTQHANLKKDEILLGAEINDSVINIFIDKKNEQETKTN